MVTIGGYPEKAGPEGFGAAGGVGAAGGAGAFGSEGWLGGLGSVGVVVSSPQDTRAQITTKRTNDVRSMRRIVRWSLQFVEL